MKNKIYLIALFCFLGFYGCGSSSSMSGSSPSERSFDQYANLAQALRSVGGVTVSGNDSNPNIILRGGGGGGIAEVQPLFVIDNVVIGNSYAQANSVITPSNIKSIRVLNGMAATNRFGQEGRGGVILITSKVSSNK